MASVGGLPFETVRDEMQLAGLRAEPFHRPGVVGTGLHVRGFHGEPFRVRVTNRYANGTLRNAAIAACFALCGTLVTAVDDQGSSWYYMMVLDFELDEQVNTVGSLVGVVYCDQWFSGTFTLIPTATRYVY